MRIVMFYHTLLSDWNHGNAHFLRGIASELIERGHDLRIFEPENAWSLRNLLSEHGQKPVRKFRAVYPNLNSIRYDAKQLDLDQALNGADLVLVHEWNEHNLVERIGQHRERNPHYKLLFHDTHHRMVTAPESMRAYDLSNYDGVLAYGNVLKELYLAKGLIAKAWTWHEAADTRVFHPIAGMEKKRDLVWIGNWGDGERTAEINEFLIEPSHALGLKTRVHGVRYPDNAKQALAEAGIEYSGWLPNFEVPRVFAEHKVTIHIPRRPYVEALPGIPTIRPFEALACGIPLISSPWDDVENLFTPGSDFLVARNGAEMKAQLKALLNDQQMADELARNGLKTLCARHTCAHRVDELLDIYLELRNEKYDFKT